MSSTDHSGTNSPPRRRQLFHPATNHIAKASIAIALLLVGSIFVVGARLSNSSYQNNADIALAQPVQFSHEHHVDGLGIQCLYCHTSVEDSAFAGIPPTHTCMTCHSQIWSDAPMLEPVRTSYETGVPIQWNRVHDLPDFVYFNHSIHVNKGVGCTTCHGQVDEMPLIRKAEPMTMGWCLDCHREPEKNLRPVEEIYNTDWVKPSNQAELGAQLVQDYHIDKAKLTNCSTCHR